MSVSLKRHGNRLSVRLDMRLWQRAPVPVEVLVTDAGLEVRRVGTRTRRLVTDWNAVLAHAVPPMTAPAKYLANPVGLITDD